MPFEMNINLSSGINAVEIFMSPYGYSPGWSLEGRCTTHGKERKLYLDHKIKAGK